MTLGAWVTRELKQIAVAALLGIIVMEGLYALLRHALGTWPLWATLGWVGLSVVMARIFPTVLLPLFYKTVPLQDQALAERLVKLCQKTGVSVLGVFRFDMGAETRKANAALAGLGKTRRVLLADTLLAEFPPEEIEGVLAHELAHHRYRHIMWLLVMNAVGSWIVFQSADLAGRAWLPLFGVRGLADLAGFPLLMLWISFLGLLGMPLQNWISRAFEWQCDRFAVRSVKEPRTYASALHRLGQLNLSDPAPPRWVVWMFYDHPPIPERVRAAQAASAA
jgi:STE24 endopeptidase